MNQLIEQLATESGSTIDEVSYIFIAISGRLINKIPPLQQVIEDVFEDVEDGKLNEHIGKLIEQLEEQRCKEKFGEWILPQWNETTHREQSNTLF